MQEKPDSNQEEKKSLAPAKKVATDLFTIPLQVKVYNEDLSARLASEHPLS